MKKPRSFTFTHAICRQPGDSVQAGLRAVGTTDPDPARFLDQHASYVKALTSAKIEVTVLPALEEYPDSVFVEDPVLIVEQTAIVLRPGADSRRGEARVLQNDLVGHVDQIINLPGTECIDGGDILLTETEALVGKSARTSASAIDALADVLTDFDYETHTVNTPDSILHFKSDCGLLDASTIFATPLLARSGALDNYTIIETPTGEEAAANLIRVNDAVILNSDFPQSTQLLTAAGYQVKVVDTGEAALIDGGLSCMSLRYRR